MKRILVTGLAAMVLAGCATSATTWTKPGATGSASEQDLRACDRDANRIARAEGKPGHLEWSTQGARLATRSGGLEALRRVEHDEKVAACMKSKGYDKPS